MSSFRIGDRVRWRGSSHVGTVFAVPYSFQGYLRVGIRWDDAPNRFLATNVADVVRLPAAKPFRVSSEARPIAVGAMAGGGR